MDKITLAQLRNDAVDHQITVALQDWETLPGLAAEWHEWDDGSRFDFLTDWPVAEERTRRLLALAAALAPDDVRAAQLRLLQRLVVQNRPILQALHASVTADQAAVPIP